MCARYGLDERARIDGRFPLEPLREEGNAARLARWLREQGATARITGARARNLNPIITAPEGERRLEFGWWWLHIDDRPAPFSAFNSRGERLNTTWRAAFQRRGLLPANWYIEKGVRFALPDRTLFTLAAITHRFIAADGQELISYSLVTREALGPARATHPRMPLIVPQSMRDRWLDPNRPGDDNLAEEALAASEDPGRAVTPIDAPSSSRSPRLF